MKIINNNKLISLLDESLQTNDVLDIMIVFLLLLNFWKQNLIFCTRATFEPRHEKTCLCHMRTTKA